MRQVIGWDHYFLRQAQEVRNRSKDPSTQVGAILVDQNRQILGTGYNGFPWGVKETPERWERPTKMKYVIHAEVNAMIQAGINGSLSRAYTMYSTHFPCAECSKTLVQTRIKRIVIPASNNLTATHNPQEAVQFSRAMFKEVGIEVIELPVGNCCDGLNDWVSSATLVPGWVVAAVVLALIGVGVFLGLTCK